MPDNKDSAVILRRTFQVGSIPGITNSEKELGELRDWYRSQEGSTDTDTDWHKELERSVPAHTEERSVLEDFWNRHALGDKEETP